MTASLSRAALVAAIALGSSALAAGGGTITGTVDATPAKYLDETVVYLTEVSGSFTPKTHTLDQKGMKFLPHVATVTVGDTVDFMNHDGVDHNVFSPDNETFNLGMIKNGAKGSFTFKKAGHYSLLCSVHPEMLGFIFVGQNPYSAAVDAKGKFKLQHVPAGAYQLEIWNSHLKAAPQQVTVTDGKTAEANFSLKR